MCLMELAILTKQILVKDNSKLEIVTYTMCSLCNPLQYAPPRQDCLSKDKNQLPIPLNPNHLICALFKRGFLASGSRVRYTLAELRGKHANVDPAAELFGAGSRVSVVPVLPSPGGRLINPPSIIVAVF